MSDSLETDRSSHTTADAEESVAAAGGAGVEGGKAEAVLTTMPVLLEQAEPSWRYVFRSFLGCNETMHDCDLNTFCVRALSGNDSPETHP